MSRGLLRTSFIVDPRGGSEITRYGGWQIGNDGILELTPRFPSESHPLLPGISFY